MMKLRVQKDFIELKTLYNQTSELQETDDYVEGCG